MSLPLASSEPAVSNAAPFARPLRILTWHVHGNYLYALTRLPHQFFIPVDPRGRPGYSPLGAKIPWGKDVREISIDAIRNEEFDCIIYQSQATYEDSVHYLSPAQQALPSVYIEHDPPRPSPYDTAHCFRHKHGIVVHVTHYNALNWDNGDTPATVIEHGVPYDGTVRYRGDLNAGITVINGLPQRGRRMGADLFEAAREVVPLDLIGMQSEQMGGLGEVDNLDVASTMARYRFFYTPIRYTSLGLALVEAMLIGMPIVGVAATELPTVIVNGVNGFVHTDHNRVIDVMRQLVNEPELARQWGAAARETALERFAMRRFVDDWQDVLTQLTTNTAVAQTM